MPTGLSRFIPRNRSNERGYPPHVSMGRVLERMIGVQEGRTNLEREFDRDVRRTPLWHLLETRNQPNGVREDLRKLYGALRSMGMDVDFGPDRSHPRTPHHDSWECALRFGHRIWVYRFSPHLMESSVDAQHHMIETIAEGAKTLFMEVALDNVLDNDHSVMPHRRPVGGNALRYAASQRIEFGPVSVGQDDPPRMRRPTPRRDRPGFNVDFQLPDMRDRPRVPAPPRVPFPDTAELRANAGADLDHLDEAVEHLDDVPDTPFGPSETALEQSYRV